MSLAFNLCSTFSHTNHLYLPVKTSVMAETASAPASSELKYHLDIHQKLTGPFNAATTVQDITTLREQYRCPHFRILVIGRANAGKTTILEKVCGVAKGTTPIIVQDEKGKLNEFQCAFSCSIPSRSTTGSRGDTFDSLN